MIRRVLVLVSLLVALVGVGLPVSPVAQAADPPRIPLKWEPQENYYYCGPAAIRMALTAPRLAVSRIPNQKEIAREARTTERDGTSRYGVRDALNHYQRTNPYTEMSFGDGVNTPDERRRLWEHMVADVRKGYPVLVNIVVRAGGPRPPGYEKSTKVDHWVVVYGLASAGQRVYIADPASGRSGFNPHPTYTMTLTELSKLINKTYVW